MIQIPPHITEAIVLLLKPYHPQINPETIERLFEERPPRPLLKINETARMLALSRVHISRLAEKGELCRVNVGLEKNLYR